MTILKIELFHGTMLQTTKAKQKTKQVQLEKKGKNKSREEIFYQMKVFLCLFISVVGSVFL